MATRAVIPFLVGMMLLTGVCNTLLTKYQDMQCVRNCDSPDPKRRHTFEQPVWQTVQMFVGEAGCWLVVLASAMHRRYFKKSSRGEYEPVGGQLDADTAVSTDGLDTDEPAKPIQPVVERKPLTGWRVILLALPATCDIIATSLMNVGLLLVVASIYQMTRGALVLFVGLFSVVFLRSRLALYKWLALVIVVLGVAIVGLAGVVESREPKPLPGHSDPEAGHGDLFSTYIRLARASMEADIDGNVAVQTVLGIGLIFLAQIFTASQFVLEESIMHRFSLSPINVVGWEGTFGLLITLLAMAIAHLVYGRTPAGRGGYFDVTTGWHEMTHNRAVGVTSFLIMLSIGGFNYFGLSVTRSVSATSRSTIDTCRTLFVWLISLGLGWESFKWLQVLGFAGLVYGTFLFNDIVKPPRIRACLGLKRKEPEAEGQDLLPDRPAGLAES